MCLLQIEAGVIENGRAEKSGTNTMGGNVYCGGTMVMTGGTIRGGYAHFGGNVQVQGAAAVFTMQGGVICDGTAGYKTDVADLCTGQASNEKGFAMFRMEGGYIETAAYSQGNILLTGTTDTANAVRVVVKKPGDRLVIQGTYTGHIDLVLNDDQYLGLPAGARIGKADNADISGAIINLPDYPDMELAVQGSDLVLRNKTMVLVNGTAYHDMTSAVSAYNTSGGQMRLMTNGLQISGLRRDLHLDLNGKRLLGVQTGSYTLYCKDSATDDFSSPTESAYGALPAGTAYQPEEGYLAVTDGDWISFHRYEIALTAVNLRPGNAGIYYSTCFRGDEVFRAQVQRYGVAVSLEDGKWQQQLAKGENCVWMESARWTAGDTATNSVLIQDIMKPTLTDAQNSQRAQLPVYGICFVQLKDGRQLFGQACGYSLRQVLEQFDSSGQSIPTTVLDMYKTYASVMSPWNLPRIKTAAQ